MLRIYKIQVKKAHQASRFFEFYAKQKINLTWPHQSIHKAEVGRVFLFFIFFCSLSVLLFFILNFFAYQQQYRPKFHNFIILYKQVVGRNNRDIEVILMKLQSNLYKTTTLRTTQKQSSWTCGCFIKHLYKTTTNKIWSFLAGFQFLFPL